MPTLSEEVQAADAGGKFKVLAEAKAVFRIVNRDGNQRIECFVESDEIDETQPEKPVSFAVALAAYTFSLFMKGVLIRDAASSAGVSVEALEVSAVEKPRGEG